MRPREPKRAAIGRPAATILGAALAAASCTDELVVAPVIDAPAPGSDADPFPSLDEIELTLGIEGSDEALSTTIFRRGEALVLHDAPYSENLVIHMTGRIGGSEVAYGRTCPFAIRAGDPAPAPHLYFSRTVKWADAPTPSEAVRVGGAATTYHDGSAMFVGGVGEAATPLTAVDRFDPMLGTFEIVGQLTSRQEVQAGMLGDRYVIVGGIDTASAQLATYLELIEVDTTPARRIERFPAGGLAFTGHALAELTDGRVIVVGGRDATSVRGTITEIDNDGSGVSLRTLTATLATPRRDHVATRLSDALGAPVLITGGRDIGDQLVATAELYRPLSESIAPVTEFAPRMVVPRRNHQTARLADDSVLVVGGFDAAGQPVTTLELFSFERDFVDVGQVPSDAGITGQSITTLADGRLLLTGGVGSNGLPVDTAFIVRVDQVDGSLDLIATDSLSVPRAGHQATLLCDGTVLVVGGTASPSSAERYNPPALGRR